MYPEWVVTYKPPNDMSKCLFIMLGTLFSKNKSSMFKMFFMCFHPDGFDRSWFKDFFACGLVQDYWHPVVLITGVAFLFIFSLVGHWI